MALTQPQEAFLRQQLDFWVISLDSHKVLPLLLLQRQIGFQLKKAKDSIFGARFHESTSVFTLKMILI